MSLIIATGSNLDNKLDNLSNALRELKKHLTFIAASRIYQSRAVEYLNQPDFYNQVLEFEIPKNLNPSDTMSLLLSIEDRLGRVRSRSSINKGPRIIDLDILFIGLQSIDHKNIIIPHPRLFERSFVVLPLMELPFFNTLSKNYQFPKEFDNSAEPI